MLTLEIKQPNRILWQTINRVSHNLLYPAYTSWHFTIPGVKRQKYYESYWVNGEYHRNPTEGPAYTRWYENASGKKGQKAYESYWVNGKLHREVDYVHGKSIQGPAITSWYVDGQKIMKYIM